MARTKTAPDSEATTKVTTCTSVVKGDDFTYQKCGNRVLRGLCGNREHHVTPFPSGFCGIGAHEGARLPDARGNLMKTCEFWQTCPCDCHHTYDKMFAMSGMARIVMDNSGYEVPKNEYWFPTPEERAAMRAAAVEQVSIEAVVIESPDPENIPSSLVKSFAPTASGRAARGELESRVRGLCDEWLVEKYGDLCTPAWIKERLGRLEGDAGPSVGAVDAVFKRWETLGFAVISRKPTRFTQYTPDGIRLGLEALKIKAKDRARSNLSPNHRILRPAE